RSPRRALCAAALAVAGAAVAARMSRSTDRSPTAQSSSSERQPMRPALHLAEEQKDRPDLINPGHPDRLQPRPLQAELQDGVITLPIEVRDYPLLIKRVRMK
ncbi:MAG: hypothetical protein JXB13_16940, partial [Phycisphaerae bacterium]|nr:hypothetical protein [Phycisphaerae bacterium]